MDRILSTSNETAKAVLIALCHDDYTLARALRHIEKLDARTMAEISKTDQNNPKRKELPMICIQCQESFYESENSSTASDFHDGEMEPDLDFWPDYDERCHGPIDTKENREEYPEKFTWDCCDKGEEEPVCTNGRHAALDNPSGKGVKLDLSSSYSSSSSQASE